MWNLHWVILMKIDQEVPWYIGKITRPRNPEIKIMILTFGLEHYFNFRILGPDYLPYIPWNLLIYFYIRPHSSHGVIFQSQWQPAHSKNPKYHQSKCEHIVTVHYCVTDRVLLEHRPVCQWPLPQRAQQVAMFGIVELQTGGMDRAYVGDVWHSGLVTEYPNTVNPSGIKGESATYIPWCPGQGSSNLQAGQPLLIGEFA